MSEFFVLIVFDLDLSLSLDKKNSKKNTHPASLKAAERIKKLVPVHEMNPKAS